MKKKEKLFGALEYTDERYIDSAAQAMMRKKRVSKGTAYRKIMLTAACVALAAVMLVAAVLPLMRRGQEDIPSPSETPYRLGTSGDFVSISFISAKTTQSDIDNDSYDLFDNGGESNTDISYNTSSIRDVIPLITFKCDKNYKIVISSEVCVVRDTAPYTEKYGNAFDGPFLVKYRANDVKEITVSGNATVFCGYNMGDPGCEKDSYIDYTVYDTEDNIVGAGSILVSNLNLVEKGEEYDVKLKDLTHLTYETALFVYTNIQTRYSDLTVRRVAEIYSESFVKEDGSIDGELRDAYFSAHGLLSDLRYAVSEEDAVDPSMFADEDAPPTRPTLSEWIDKYYDEFYSDSTEISETERSEAVTEAVSEPAATLEEKLSALNDSEKEIYDSFLEKKEALKEELFEDLSDYSYIMGASRLVGDYRNIDLWIHAMDVFYDEIYVIRMSSDYFTSNDIPTTVPDSEYVYIAIYNGTYGLVKEYDYPWFGDDPENGRLLLEDGTLIEIVPAEESVKVYPSSTLE